MYGSSQPPPPTGLQRIGGIARRLLRLRSRPAPVEAPQPPAAAPTLAAALLAQARGSKGVGLEEICERALQQAPDELWTLFEIGSVARDYALSKTAERVYGHILARAPDSGYAAFHYARLCAIRGDDDEAWRALEQVRTASAYDEYVAALRAQILSRRGKLEQAGELMETVREPALRAEALAHLDYGRFEVAFPPAKLIQLVRDMEESPRYLQAAAVAELAGRALDAGEGFSMVRIGDGEAAFLSLSPDDDQRYAALYARNRQDRARIWFQDQLDLEASGFRAEMVRISDVMSGATVLGIPYTGRIEHELRIRSITGVSALGNVLRWVSSEGADKRLCCQDVHYELQRDGHLAALFARVDELALIACHPDLPERLKRRFGLKSVEFHKLPGEKAMKAVIGDAAAQGQHYPEVFHRVMDDLDRPLNARLFIVAGGILGKFYCERIRASGGVAIDVGSVADSWVGAETRPTFDPHMVL